MEGSVKSLEPRAAGLRSWFPRHGCGTAILESALSKRCGAGLGVGLAVSPFQPCSVMGEVAKPLSEGGPRGPYAWPWASQLRGCAAATPTLQPLRGPLGLPRTPQGGGQGEEPLGAPQSCHDVVQFWLSLSGGILSFFWVPSPAGIEALGRGMWVSLQEVLLSVLEGNAGHHL